MNPNNKINAKVTNLNTFVNVSDPPSDRSLIHEG